MERKELRNLLERLSAGAADVEDEKLKLQAEIPRARGSIYEKTRDLPAVN